MNILYVEDDPDIREIVAFAISLEPAIELRAFASGPEAIAALDAEGWTPDGILLDFIMPDMDGGQTLRAIRRRPRHARTPAAFLTSLPDPGLAHGDPYVVAVLEKPFSPLSLPAQLLRLFGPSGAEEPSGSPAGPSRAGGEPHAKRSPSGQTRSQ